MFTIISFLFSLCGMNLSQGAVKLIGVLLIIAALAGGYFYFRHEISAYIAGRVTKIETQHTQAVNESTQAIQADQARDNQQAVQAQTEKQAQVDKQATRVEKQIQAKPSMGHVGPATEKAIQGIRQMMQQPAPVPTQAEAPRTVVPGEKTTNPSIQEWLAKKTGIDPTPTEPAGAAPAPEQTKPAQPEPHRGLLGWLRDTAGI